MTQAAMADALPSPATGPDALRWHRIGLVLGLSVLALLALFGDEDRAAVQVWIDSTAYGHCFFVLPIALFLAWERRAVVAAMPLRPLPWLAVLALPTGAIWFGAERLGLMEGQQLVAMGGLQLLFLAALGWRFYRAMAVPLLYLVFLVPFGAFITPMLQDFTAAFIRHGLDLFGIANYSDGNIIEIPEGRFFVAEACAGLRFLIASVAFGVLYACMIYRSAGRRIAFIAASVVIPIIANGVRALGIVTLGHIIGSAEAATVDHVLYGWMFFSLVILLLIAAGLPFRQDDTAPAVPPRLPDAPGALRAMMLASALVVGLTALAPLWAGWFERQDATSPITLADAIGCLPQTSGPHTQAGAQIWRFSCPASAAGIDHLDMQVTRLRPHANAGALAQARRVATGELAAENVDLRTIEDRPDTQWQLVTTIKPDRIVAIANWADGVPAQAGWAARVDQARRSLTASASAPILLTIASPAAVEDISPDQRTQLLRAIQGIIVRNRSFAAELAILTARPQP